DPAACSVYRGESENSSEQDNCYDQCSEYKVSILINAIINPTGHKHRDQAGERKSQLFVKIGELALFLRFFERDHRRRAIDHYAAENRKTVGDQKHKPICRPAFNHSE